MVRFGKHQRVPCPAASSADLRLAPGLEKVAAFGTVAAFPGAYRWRSLWVIATAARAPGDAPIAGRLFGVFKLARKLLVAYATPIR